MAKSAKDKIVKSNFLDLLGESRDKFEPVKFESIADSLEYVAAVYTEKLNKELALSDATSSGELADSILALDVELLGTTYTVAIEAKKYADFVNAGVNGWAQDRGAPFSFKTKGVDPNGAMVKSIKKWLVREGAISRNTKKTVTAREGKRAKITDTNTKAAITAAYMIKRQGIAPTKFWDRATAQMDAIVKQEFGEALRIDIINNITNN